MRFRTHRPPAALRPYVDVAHGYEVPASPARVHRGLPSRHVTLVLDLVEPLHVRGTNNAVAAHGVVGGLHTGPAHIDASRPQVGLQYALSPLTCEALLGQPAGALAGFVVDLDDLLGAVAVELVDRLAATPDWDERFGLVDAALLRRLDAAPPPDPAVAEAWRLVFATGGRVPVAQVAEHVGFSRRHLAQQVRSLTGVTPKQAARISRFEAARSLLLAPGRPSLAGIAATCGYADQAHFAREWKTLAGCTASTWLREELPFVQDTVGDAAASSSP